MAATENALALNSSISFDKSIDLRVNTLWQFINKPDCAQHGAGVIVKQKSLTSEEEEIHTCRKSCTNVTIVLYLSRELE